MVAQLRQEDEIDDPSQDNFSQPFGFTANLPRSLPEFNH